MSRGEVNCVVVLARVKLGELRGRISGLVGKKYGGVAGEGYGVPPADHAWREMARLQMEGTLPG